jgi:hypothetical protein
MPIPTPTPIARATPMRFAVETRAFCCWDTTPLLIPTRSRLERHWARPVRGRACTLHFLPQPDHPSTGLAQQPAAPAAEPALWASALSQQPPDRGVTPYPCATLVLHSLVQINLHILHARLQISVVPSGRENSPPHRSMSLVRLLCQRGSLGTHFPACWHSQTVLPSTLYTVYTRHG